jgi:hypothetical protein
MRPVAAMVVLLVALSGCGRPKTGDQVSIGGELVKPPEAWAGPPVGLRSHDLPGGFVYLQGHLGGFEPGDKVRVEGTFFEYSIHMRSVIRVEAITKR